MKSISKPVRTSFLSRPLALLMATALGTQGLMLPSRAFADGAAGADGVDLQIVPVDTGENCSSIILKGTNRFQGTAFVMPRVIVGLTKQHESLFEIAPNGNNRYLMTLGLYFPASHDALSLHTAASELYVQGCNFESAIHQINASATDPSQRVERLARLPVSGIEVAVDGITARGYIGSRGNDTAGATTLLNYEGTDQTVEFDISQAEKDALMRRLERKQGLSIMVNMSFAARSNDGALYAEVDLDDVANRVKADLGGQYMIATADLGTEISKVVSSANVKIRTEAGSGANFGKIVDQLVAMITTAVPDAHFGETADPGTPQPAQRPQTAPNQAPTTYPPTTYPPMQMPTGQNGGQNGPVQPGQLLPGGFQPIASPTPTNGPTVPPLRPLLPFSQVFGQSPAADVPTSIEAPLGGGLEANALTALSPVNLKLSAVYSYLHSQHKRTISYDNTSALEMHVFSTPINFQAKMLDPDVQELYVRAGEASSLVPESIRKGDQITIGVRSAAVENIQYHPHTKYLTVNELQDIHAATYFPGIQDDLFVLANQDTKMGYIAVGKLTKKSVLGSWGIGAEAYDLPARYFWSRTMLTPDYSHRVVTRLAPTIDALKGLSLEATFSKVGIRRFQLADLVQDNAYWSATFDDFGGTIQLTAKRDLGYLAISSTAPRVTQTLVTDRVTEEIRAEGAKPLSIAPDAATTKADLPVKRNSYMLEIGRPSDDSGTQTIAPLTTPMASNAPSAPTAR